MIALAYAKRELREDFHALLALDAALGNALRAAVSPQLPQIRLAWWREQLASEAQAEPAADPVIMAIRNSIRRHGVKRRALVDLVNGWETLLDDWPLSAELLLDYARLRGGGLFSSAADVAGIVPDYDCLAAGGLWALADFAKHCSDQSTESRAREIARAIGAKARQLPKALRPFAILTRFAERDIAAVSGNGNSPGSPTKMIQALGFVCWRR